MLRSNCYYCGINSKLALSSPLIYCELTVCPLLLTAMCFLPKVKVTKTLLFFKYILL